MNKDIEEIVEDLPNKYLNTAGALGIGIIAGIASYALEEDSFLLKVVPALTTLGYFGAMGFARFNKNIKNKPDAYINNTLSYIGVTAGFLAPYLIDKMN